MRYLNPFSAILVVTNAKTLLFKSAYHLRTSAIVLDTETQSLTVACLAFFTCFKKRTPVKRMKKSNAQ